MTPWRPPARGQANLPRLVRFSLLNAVPDPQAGVVTGCLAQRYLAQHLPAAPLGTVSPISTAKALQVFLHLLGSLPGHGHHPARGRRRWRQRHLSRSLRLAPFKRRMPLCAWEEGTGAPAQQVLGRKNVHGEARLHGSHVALALGTLMKTGTGFCKGQVLGPVRTLVPKGLRAVKPWDRQSHFRQHPSQAVARPPLPSSGAVTGQSSMHPFPRGSCQSFTTVY